MIHENYKNFTNINYDSVEGKLLMSALSVLTSIDKEDIKEGKYGGSNHPDDVMEKIWELANYIFYQQEFEDYKLIEERDKKIDSFLKK